MKLELGWLTTLEVKDGEKSAPRVAASKEPVKGDILIYKNGFIYFSKDLKKRLGDKLVDFVFLSDWNEANKKQEGLLFVPIEKGTAKPSVSKSGIKVTFIKEQLIPMLKDKMDVDVEELGSIELGIDWEQKIELGNGIYHFSKLVPSGKSKGTYSLVRRENVEIYPMGVLPAEANAEQQELPFDEAPTDETEVENQEEVTID